MEGEDQKSLFRALQQKIDELAMSMEKMKLAEYVQLLDNPRRLLYVNFISGLARGFGIAIGFTILGAVVLLVLKKLLTYNLPWIGGVIAEIVKMVQMKMGS